MVVQGAKRGPVEAIFEDNTLAIALANSLGPRAVVACRASLVALDPALATSCRHISGHRTKTMKKELSEN
jgi:hypothetical protein